MNRRPGRAFLLILLAFAAPSSADAFPQARSRILPVDEMARQADVIGVATVLSSRVREESRTGLICTDFRLEFSEVWKGDPGREFVLVKAGGQLPSGDKVTVPGHEYVLKPGEAIVVFAIPSMYGNHVAIDFRQGLYRIGPGGDRPVYRMTGHPFAIGKKPDQSFHALKEEVWKTLGRPVDFAPAPPAPSTGSPAAGPAAERGSLPPAAHAPAPAPLSPSRGGPLLILGLMLMGGIVLLLIWKKRSLSR